MAPANLRRGAAANSGLFPARRVIAAIGARHAAGRPGAMPEFAALKRGAQAARPGADGDPIRPPTALLAVVEHVETLQDL